MTGDAYISYLFEKGGIENLNREVRKDGLFLYPMCLVPPETGGWFQKEIKSIDDFKDITFLRRQQCQLSLIQRQTCTTFCHCDCEEWVACFLEFFSAGYGSHSGALCHQTSHSEVKYCLQNIVC